MDVQNPDILARMDAFSAEGDQARASVDNLRFDERVAEARRQAWEAAVAARPGTIRDAHARYVKSHINRITGEPASFEPDNAWALLPAPAGNQDLVRIETLGPWLDELWDGTAESFVADVEGWQAGGASLRLEAFLEDWNQYRDRRPVFAAFRDELRDEVKAGDWAGLLRNQLGLAHLNASQDDPKVLALMQYRVRDVLDVQPEAEHDRTFAAPTSLDAALNPWFYPTPRLAEAAGDRSYGAAVHLDGPARKLVCEVLHRHMPYRLEHLKKAAILTQPLKQRTIPELRDGHLGLLRNHRGRPDFGAMMA